MKRYPVQAFALLCLSLVLGSCTGIPDGVEPVTGFELERYLGDWYEVARLDHRFERGLSDVSANYSRRADGGLDVLNRGYDAAAGEWREAKGKAYAAGKPGEGRLKVSFFGPFYGGYNIVELDRESYRYSLVVGPDRSYLWILARSPTLEVAVVQRLVARATELGFATDELIYVDHREGNAVDDARQNAPPE